MQHYGMQPTWNNTGWRMKTGMWNNPIIVSSRL